MDSVVHECNNLTEEDIAFLSRIDESLGILADLSRADAIMYCLLPDYRAVVVAQAMPHSMLPVHNESLVGKRMGYAESPGAIRALTEGRREVTEVRRDEGLKSPADPAPIYQETHPIRSKDGRVIAAVCIETNLIEHERHRRRSKVFQQALTRFQAAALAGELKGVPDLTPFSEHDGVMVVDAQRRIQYVSGIATSLYRKLGYAGDLLKRRVEDLEMDDHSLVLEAIDKGRCVEREMKVRDLVWIKKVIPLYSDHRGLGSLFARRGTSRRLEGAVVMIHDETDTRQQEDELRVKAAMIQEIHHRVKNNLQTIASLLRLQSRRAESQETQQALQEGINRILSVAVIHEFLAHQDARVINIRDVSQRIINQIREGVLDHEKGIRLDLRGPNIYLPTQAATVCALVINELLQNALEHGYGRQEGGTVTVNLQDDGARITIAVDDDGVGLPAEFDLSRTGSLGLQIVKALAEGDLKGTFELRGRDKGVSAVVAFPKQFQGGK